jgi:hypothetical protein
VSLLLIGLSVPMIRERVRPNPWYGLRIPITLNDPEVWYPANRYAGWLLLVYGLVQLVLSAGLALLLHKLPEERATQTYGLTVTAAMLGGLVPVVILSLRFARKVADELRSNGTH